MERGRGVYDPERSGIYREAMRYPRAIHTWIVVKYQTKKPQVEARSDALVLLTSVVGLAMNKVANPVSTDLDRTIWEPLLDQTFRVYQSVRLGDWSHLSEFLISDAGAPFTDDELQAVEEERENRAYTILAACISDT